MVAKSSKEEFKFGFGRFRPKWLQWLNGPRSFLVSLSLLTVLKAFTTGYFNQTLAIIEKRFQMTSKDLGLIITANDIPGLVLISFVSYFGEHGNKVKWLGYGALITGIGAAFAVLAHLIVGDYQPVMSVATNMTSKLPVDLCLAASHNATDRKLSSCLVKYDSEWYYLFIFVMSQVIMGIGSTPLFSLGPAYIDENVHPRSVPVYIGIWYSATWLGPGLGFIFGGLISSIYVDITLPEGINLKPTDTLWISAWWLGFIVVAILNIVFAVYMLGFPRELPGAREMRDEAMEQGILAKRDKNLNGKVKELGPATLQLLKNPTFMWNTLALTVSFLWIQGYSAFYVKTLNMKFALPFETAGVLVGSLIIPIGIAGIILGGVVCRFFDLKQSCKKSALSIVILHAIFIWGGFNWWIPGCDEINLAGVQIPYNNSFGHKYQPDLVSTCNIDCACSAAVFNPVCGSDGVTYYSPCHAGCQATNGSRIFQNCTCVALPATEKSTAKMGYCDRGSGCRNIIWFFVIGGIGGIFLGMISVPTRIVILRCVPFNQRSYALGFQFVFMKLLGYIPSPVLVGAVLDTTCLLWSKSCGIRGACSLYDINNLSDLLVAMGVGSTGISMIMYFLSYWYYTPEYEKHADETKPAVEIGADDFPDKNVKLEENKVPLISRDAKKENREDESEEDDTRETKV